MPELPEVETTLRGIIPHLSHQKILDVIIRHPKLRWIIPPSLKETLTGETIEKIWRRGKYLLLQTQKGTLIIHLGMSGSLRILAKSFPAEKHDHVDIVFSNTFILRFNDPRRFGAVLWTSDDPLAHPLLRNLGPEPLTKSFSAKYLLTQSRKRKVAIKTFIMNSKVVVGVGNIYATEALFLAGIHPTKSAEKVSLAQYEKLVSAIKVVLRNAIKQGGTTLRNYVDASGKGGYFKVSLQVYGRENLPCVRCGTKLKMIRLNQRATVYCLQCQTKTTS